MWNLLGDFDYKQNKQKLASGTFFYNNAAPIPYWNMLDGVLLRPALMNDIDFMNTDVLTKTNTTEFLKPLITRKNESIIQDDLSDHLPIKITINL